jgi:integrase
LTAYGREHAPHVRDPARIAYAIDALNTWWGNRTLMDVRGSTCRAYTDHRRKTVQDGTVRRELGVLSAAIGHWHSEHGPLDSVPVVTRPKMPEPKPDWLTRSDAAALVAGALGWYRVQFSDISTRKISFAWRRDREAINRHTARFLLIGVYTGTRPGAIMGAQWVANLQGGWFDLERGVMHRMGEGEVVSNKRKPPTRLGKRILTHLRRWRKLDEAAREKTASATHLHVVNWGGGPISDIGRSFSRALSFAGLPARYTPHILRHTRATWLMQAGIAPWEAAGSIGMSVETMQKVYGHHHPDFQRKAAEV